MHDLNVIADLNAKAVQNAIPELLAQGKYVIAKYAGVNYIDCESYDDVLTAAKAAVDYESQAPGNRAKVHTPN